MGIWAPNRHISMEKQEISEMTNYREDPRINASLLKSYLDSDPRIAKYNQHNPKPPSPAMQFGTLVHSILEHKCDKMPEGFEVSPFPDFRSKAAREWKADQEEKGIMIIKEEEKEKAFKMALSVWMTSPGDIQNMLRAGDPEVAYYTKTEKALLDVVYRGVGLDYKTTQATSKDQFVRDCYKYHYPLQAAHYVDVAGLEKFYFIGVSHAAPHPCWVLECSESFLEFGRRQKAKAYQALQEQDFFNSESFLVDAPDWAID